MTDLLITLAVGGFFLAAWAAGRFLPRRLAMLYPAAALVLVAVVTFSVGLSSARDWLMVGVVVCVTSILTLAGRRARAGRASGGDGTDAA